MADQSETPGSSAQTAIAVGLGSVLGATALVAAAPILLPVGAAVLITPVIGGAIGAAAGWFVGGKK